MEVGDWITLGAVLVALGIGVTSILYTQRLRGKERKERLLNEIIDWALDIVRCGSEAGFEVTPGLPEEKQKKLIRINWAFRYQVISSKGDYIISIGSIFKREENLHRLIKAAQGDLEKAIKILWDLAGAKGAEEERLSSEATKTEEALQKSAGLLIKEATRIRTREMA